MAKNQRVWSYFSAVAGGLGIALLWTMRAHAQPCVGEGWWTFETEAAIAAWTFEGTGGVDRNRDFFPVNEQGRFPEDPIHHNNGWVGNAPGWHSISRKLVLPIPADVLQIGPVVQNSASFREYTIDVWAAQRPNQILWKRVMPAGVRNHPGFLIGNPGEYLPTELVVKISFYATSNDQWFRLDSMRILYTETAKNCRERNHLGEIL